MKRWLASYQKIKDEITANFSKYSGKLPSEIACLMNNQISKSPQQFITVPIDKVDTIREKLTLGEIEQLIIWLKSKGFLTDLDLVNKQVEVLTTVGENLGLGEIEQGDVEEALKL